MQGVLREFIREVLLEKKRKKKSKKRKKKQKFWYVGGPISSGPGGEGFGSSLGGGE